MHFWSRFSIFEQNPFIGYSISNRRTNTDLGAEFNKTKSAPNVMATSSFAFWGLHNLHDTLKSSDHNWPFPANQRLIQTADEFLSHNTKKISNFCQKKLSQCASQAACQTLRATEPTRTGAIAEELTLVHKIYLQKTNKNPVLDIDILRSIKSAMKLGIHRLRENVST